MIPILPEVEIVVEPEIVPVEVFVNEKIPPPDPVPSPLKPSTGPNELPDIDPEFVKMIPILPEVEIVVEPEIVPVEVFVNEKIPPPDPVPSWKTVNAAV